jgi:hypothetical protein
MVVYVAVNPEQGTEAVAAATAAALVHEVYESLWGYSHAHSVAAEVLVTEFANLPGRFERQLRGTSNSGLERLDLATDSTVLNASLLGLDIDRSWRQLPEPVRRFALGILHHVSPDWADATRGGNENLSYISMPTQLGISSKPADLRTLYNVYLPDTFDENEEDEEDEEDEEGGRGGTDTKSKSEKPMRPSSGRSGRPQGTATHTRPSSRSSASRSGSTLPVLTGAAS